MRLTSHSSQLLDDALQVTTSSRTIHFLNSIMRVDPCVIQWTMLKLGEQMYDVVPSPEKTAGRTEQSGTGPRPSDSIRANQDPLGFEPTGKFTVLCSVRILLRSAAISRMCLVGGSDSGNWLLLLLTPDGR